MTAASWFLAISLSATIAPPLLAETGFDTQPHWLFPQVAGVSEMKVVDFNHDGRPDLVVTGNYVSGVTWLENLGSGNWGMAGKWLESNMEEVAGVADFNGDGELDVLSIRTDSSYHKSLWLQYASGPGRFETEAVALNLSDTDFDEAKVFDINGDGLPDILGNRLIWLNQGEGRFSAVASASLPNPAASFEDNTPHRLTGPHALIPNPATGLVDYYSGMEGMVIKTVNLGEGRFSAWQGVPMTRPVDRWISEATTTAMTVISLPEISSRPCLLQSVEHNPGGTKRFELYRQEENGSMTLISSLPIPGKSVSQTITSMAAFQTEEGPRVITAFSKTSVTESLAMELHVTVRNGKASMKLTQLSKDEGVFFAPAVADLDGDGQSDLMLAGTELSGLDGSERLMEFFGKKGALSPNYRLVGGPAGNICFTGDLDGNGEVDFVVRTGGEESSVAAPVVSLLMNQGGGRSFSPVRLPVPKVTDLGVVAVKDWSNDGYPDVLIWTTSEGRNSNSKATNRLILFNRLPNGRVQQKTLITNTGAKWINGELIQGNSTGILDFKASVSMYPSTGYQLYPGKGVLKFTSHSSEAGEGALYAPLWDLNWDGLEDQINENWWKEGGSSNRDGEHFLPTTEALFGPANGIGFATFWPAGQDFDGDGHPDFLMKFNSGAKETPLLARGADPSSPTYPFGTGGADGSNYSQFPAGTVFADLDGDGSLDAIYNQPGDVYGDPYSLVWQKNLGGLIYGPPTVIREISPGFVESVTDVDGDGIPDILIGSPGGHFSYKGTR